MTDIKHVTHEMVENEIDSVHFFTAAEGVLGKVVADNYSLHMDDTETVEEAVFKASGLGVRLGTLTICVIVTKNGFTFIGTSIPVDPTAFNAEVGEQIARERAVEQIWPHLGFRLRDEIQESNIEITEIL